MFAYTEYQKYLGDSILDVGGFRGALKDIFPGRYENIDMEEGADHTLDLDSIERLPFEDGAFDTIICTDALEHLENIHLIFDEICRVAGKSVIISMPNAWSCAQQIVGGIRSQLSRNRLRCLKDHHWTLPLDKPTDRHRWFDSLSEADAMIRYRAKKMNFETCEYNPHVISGKKLSFINMLRSVHCRVWSEEDFANIYAWVGWWVICRNDNG